jgi:hypothetical protein
LSAWIVALRNLLFRKKSCANSQRETPRQVRPRIESYFSPRINGCVFRTDALENVVVFLVGVARILQIPHL